MRIIMFFSYVDALSSHTIQTALVNCMTAFLRIVPWGCFLIGHHFFFVFCQKKMSRREKGSAVFLIFFLQTRFEQNWLTIVFLLPISVVYGELFVNFWWMFQLLDINDPSLNNKFWLLVNNESFFLFWNNPLLRKCSIK